MGSVKESLKMKASMVLIFSFITTLNGKHLLIETVDDKAPRVNSSDYAPSWNSRGCFPDHWEKQGCPYREGVRILKEKQYDLTNQRDTQACNEYCHNMDRCKAWTFHIAGDCYTYDELPNCYKASEGYPNWNSGNGKCGI